MIMDNMFNMSMGLEDVKILAWDYADRGVFRPGGVKAKQRNMMMMPLLIW